MGASLIPSALERPNVDAIGDNLSNTHPRRPSRRAFLGATSAGVAAAAGAIGGLAHADPTGASPRIHRRDRSLPDPATIDATDPALLSATEAASLLRARTLHPAELLDACLARTAAFDGETQAWVRLYPEVAREQANAAARRLSASGVDTNGAAPLVCGLPVALKDLVAVGGLPLTASSKVLHGNIASGDATVWRKLRESGAVLMGHAHTDEFAISTRTPQVGNPWDLRASVGGSSGGSAAALSARFAPLAIGTDTGGSVRIPASRCGVSAIKPTFGTVSTHGVIPLLWTRDHVGAMGRSVADAALLLSVIAGADEADPVTRVTGAVPTGGYPTAASGRSRPFVGMRFGRTPVSGRLPAELDSLFKAFLNLVRGLGGEIVDVSLPDAPLGLITGDNCELGMYHRQFTDRLGDYRPENVPVVAVALASQATPMVDYWKFERERLTYQHAYNRVLVDNGLTCILVPGVPDDGVKRVDEFPGAVFATASADTVMWANYTGAPVVSLPIGRSAKTGLPFGVQIGGLPWSDSAMIEVALEIQAVEPAWRQVPPLQPSPRTVPEYGRARPGLGPNPTNTDAAGPAFRFVPTVSTAPV